jgi:hypothetical protein
LLEPAFAVGEETETGPVVGVGVSEIFVGLAAGDFGISNWDSFVYLFTYDIFSCRSGL